MDAEALLNILRQRRNVPQANLLPDAIDRLQLESLLEAANWAPSHGKTEPWRFVVFSGEARRSLGETFAQSYALATPADKFNAESQEGQRQRVWKAPYWVAIGMEPSGRYPEWEEVASVATAVHNMQLMATALGLGSFWASGAPVTHPNTAAFVGLEPPCKLLGFLLVGKPAKWPEGVRKPWQDKVQWRDS